MEGRRIADSVEPVCRGKAGSAATHGSFRRHNEDAFAPDAPPRGIRAKADCHNKPGRRKGHSNGKIQNAPVFAWAETHRNNTETGAAETKSSPKTAAPAAPNSSPEVNSDPEKTEGSSNRKAADNPSAFFVYCHTMQRRTNGNARKHAPAKKTARSHKTKMADFARLPRRARNNLGLAKAATGGKCIIPQLLPLIQIFFLIFLFLFFFCCII